MWGSMHNGRWFKRFTSNCRKAPRPDRCGLEVCCLSTNSRWLRFTGSTLCVSTVLTCAGALVWHQQPRKRSVAPPRQGVT